MILIKVFGFCRCDKRSACFPHSNGLFINTNSWVPLKVECLENCDEENSQYDWNIFAYDLKTGEQKEIENRDEHLTSNVLTS